MWFKRSITNRRLRREQVLDVKLRSSQVRAGRLRLAAVALGMLFATILGLYILWRAGEWVLDELVYRNKAFALRVLDVQTDGVISVDQLRRWIGVRPGTNLMAVDLARVKRDLELVPLIQSVSIERVLPHTLRVRVIEREPLAQVSAPRPRPGGGLQQTTFHLDAEGYVMPSLDLRQRGTPPSQPDEQLPFLWGIGAGELQPGRRIEAAQVKAALDLIAAYSQSPMAGLVDLKCIDVSSPDVLVVTTEQGSEITFGLGDPERQLRRWREVFDLGQRLSKAIATLDLAVTNNIPARWLEASAVPPGGSKSPKPVRNVRKKHV